jgi:hypothetical protein
VLHHAVVAVQRDVAVEHRVADEALVACSHDHGRACLECHIVEPFAGKPRIIRIEAGAGGIDQILAFAVARRDDLKRIDVDMEGVSSTLFRY